MDSINWLWLGGGLFAVWLIIQTMSRRQSRLTGTLRDHVEQTQAAQKAAIEAANPKSDSTPPAQD